MSTNVKHKAVWRCHCFFIIIVKLSYYGNAMCLTSTLHALFHSLLSTTSWSTNRWSWHLYLDLHKSGDHLQNHCNILLLLHINWQVETDYHPTFIELTLASKLLQTDKYILFWFCNGEKKRAFKLWNIKLQLITQLCVLKAVLLFPLVSPVSSRYWELA